MSFLVHFILLCRFRFPSGISFCFMYSFCISSTASLFCVKLCIWKGLSCTLTFESNFHWFRNPGWQLFSSSTLKMLFCCLCVVSVSLLSSRSLFLHPTCRLYSWFSAIVTLSFHFLLFAICWVSCIYRFTVFIRFEIFSTINFFKSFSCLCSVEDFGSLCLRLPALTNALNFYLSASLFPSGFHFEESVGHG